MSEADFEIIGNARYDISEHIKYILEIFKYKSHETWGLSAVLESISKNPPVDSFIFSSNFFVEEFSNFLHRNDVIESATAVEVEDLSTRILAKSGRNYTLVDLIKAWEIILHSWNVQRGIFE